MEVDPEHRRVSLGASFRSGGSNELGHGAVARMPFSVESSDWVAVRVWMDSEPARALLLRIEKGHTCDMLWSGDRVGRWTEDALDALRALHMAVAQQL